MNKSDLKSGMRVITRNRCQYIVIGDILYDIAWSYLELKDYTEGLKSLDESSMDIVSVFDVVEELFNPLSHKNFKHETPLWQRQELSEQEYFQVDNNVPRFTEIEVRDFSGTEWERAYFIFKSEDELYSYYATNCDNGNLNCFRQARTLKPTEPEFKEGELIEVRGIDDDTWVKREYLGKLNEFYICRSRGDVIGWKYARKIEGK